jgi:Uma2 family endonuclease
MTQKTVTPITYPDSDGQPMADNTLQFSWIVLIKENLEILYSENDNVFVAGDLLWYPVEGNNKIRLAPDVMVVLGRPKGERGSYRQWEENNIPPQVVFEILSPGNRTQEMMKKMLFYQEYGVEEYYIYDPADKELSGFVREDNQFKEIKEINNWVSPLLKIKFVLTPLDGLLIYRPEGEKFLSPVELNKQREQALRELEAEKQRYQELLDKLRQQGINPEAL